MKPNLDNRRALEQAERLRTLLAASPDPIFFKDGEGHWLEVNAAGLDLFGMKEGEYQGESDQELAAQRPVQREALETCAATDALAWQAGRLSRVQEIIPGPDGTPRFFDVFKVPLYHPDGRRRGLVVLARDITQHKHAEEQLRRIVETTPAAILMIDPSGRIRFANQGVTNLTGIPTASIIGKRPDELSIKIATLDGGAIPLDPSRIPQNISEREVAIERADGREVIVSVSTAPLSAPASGLVVAARDVTERAQLDRIKSSFIKIAAHELRTPLTPLKLLLQQTRLDLAEGRPLEAGVLDRLERQTTRLTHIVDALLDVARLEQGPRSVGREVIDLRTLVAEVVEGHRLQARDRKIRLASPDEPAPALVEPLAIERVVSNLLENALTYSPGDVDVSVGLTPASIRVAVTDRGAGIAPEHQVGLFSRFYRVRSEATVLQPGLGLGLYISREIITQHDGKIGFHSELGRGSTFYFTVPRR